MGSKEGSRALVSDGN